MKTRFIISIFTIMLVSLVSCQRIEDEQNPTQALTLAETNVSDDFSWSTAQQVSIAVNITKPTSCTYTGPQNPTVYLMDTEYNRIKAVLANNNTARFDFTIPRVMREVVVYLPESGAMQTVPVGTGMVSANLEIPCPGSGTGTAKSGGVSPDCVTECTQTISGNVSSLVVPKKSTYCLTGNLNGPLEIAQGSTLKICGTANITTLKLTKDGGEDDGDEGNGDPKNGIKIIVTTTGTLTAEALTIGRKGDYLINYGTTTIGNLKVMNAANVQNFKTMTIAELTTEKKGEIDNDGQMNVGKIHNDGIFHNKAKLTVTGTVFTENPPAIFINECMMKVSGSLKVGGKFTNIGGLVSAGNIQLNYQTQFETKNGAMLNTGTLAWNDTHVKSTGATSVFKVSGTTNITSKAKVTGPLDICDANGIEVNAASFKDNVVYCAAYIPKDACNDVGSGSPTVVDTDGDGVPDGSDDYPNDPTKAFDVYYPHTGYAINGFEDLWPSYGDYDMNDLAIKFRTHYVQNAANRYVTGDFEVMLNAIGAGLHNGLGVHFVEPGTGTEKFKRITPVIVTGVSGQAEGVEGNNMVKVYTDVFDELTTYYNNVGDGPSKAPDTLRFRINFTTATAHPSNLIPDFYIFRSADRGLEVHLPDRPATLLANTSYFGTYNDDTQPVNNRWYKSATNLPWGVEIINGTNTWKHPLSKIHIGDAYPDFVPWVNSNGTQYNDWYLRPVESKVFQGL